RTACSSAPAPRSSSICGSARAPWSARARWSRATSSRASPWSARRPAPCPAGTDAAGGCGEARGLPVATGRRAGTSGRPPSASGGRLILQERDARRRVHYVVTHLAYGGAETQVVELSAEMVRRGWDVRVTSLMPADGLTDRLDELGIPWDALGVPRGRWTPRLVTETLRILRSWRPDVLHTHTLPANFV